MKLLQHLKNNQQIRDRFLLRLDSSKYQNGHLWRNKQQMMLKNNWEKKTLKTFLKVLQDTQCNRLSSHNLKVNYQEPYLLWRHLKLSHLWKMKFQIGISNQLPNRFSLQSHKIPNVNKVKDLFQIPNFQFNKVKIWIRI